MIVLILTVVILIVMVIAGIAALIMDDLISAVLASSVVSLCASLIFFILRAPDVAMTEVAIGAGLTTIVFLVAIRKTYRFEKEGEK